MVQILRSSEYQMLKTQTRFADAHCHLDLIKNPDQAVNDAKFNNLELIITAGVDSQSNKKTVELAKGIVFGVVGISPDNALSDGTNVEEIESMIKASRNMVGIGEVGLDLTVADKVNLNIQRDVFTKQVEIAYSMELPIVVHSRKTIDETLSIIKDHGIKNAVFHFFEGDEQQAKKIESYGYKISIPPALSSKRRRVIRAVDLESLFSETDSPVVGKTPSDVITVVTEIASLKGVSIEDAGETITKSIKDYFYI